MLVIGTHHLLINDLYNNEPRIEALFGVDMENEFYGFNYQPDWYDLDLGGSCGVHSLSHALNLLGIPNTIDDIKIKCRYISIKDGFFSNGTDEKGIIAGIKKYGCNPIINDNYNVEKSKSFLEKNISLGYPVIMWVNWDEDEEDTGHWLVCGGRYKNKYVIIDSAPAEDETELIDLYTWEELKNRCVWYDNEHDEGYYGFYFIAIESNQTPSCVKQMNKLFTSLSEDEDLREWWGYYLNDLLEVCDYNYGGSIQISDLIKKHFNSVTQLLSFWFADIDENDLEYELNNYLIVAEAYKLSVNKKEEALISISSSLAGTLIY